MNKKGFNSIVGAFINEVHSYLKENGMDKYSVQVKLKERRPTGAIRNLNGTVARDISFFDDAEFLLVAEIQPEEDKAKIALLKEALKKTNPIIFYE